MRDYSGKVQFQKTYQVERPDVEFEQNLSALRGFPGECGFHATDLALRLS